MSKKVEYLAKKREGVPYNVYLENFKSKKKDLYDVIANPEVNHNCIKLDKKNFPDENFRTYLQKKFDPENSGTINPKEVKEIYCGCKKIKNLKGIEHFSELKELVCADNNLETLTLIGFPKLEIVNCGGNKLKSLKIENNKLLKKFHCGKNNIKELTLKDFPYLTELYCDDNKINKLEIDSCPCIEYLEIQHNKIKELDCSGFPQIHFLLCDNIKITSNKPKITLQDLLETDEYFFDCYGFSLVDGQNRFEETAKKLKEIRESGNGDDRFYELERRRKAFIKRKEQK